jgi:cytochrome P450
MARTVGQFGIPADAGHSNHGAEERLGEVIRRRREEIAAGAEADRPDIISQILLAGPDGMLDEAEQGGLTHLILSASTDAPAALLTNCVAVLDKFPALQPRSRDCPRDLGRTCASTVPQGIRTTPRPRGVRRL